jgi:hypothetical protein
MVGLILMVIALDGDVGPGYGGGATAVSGFEVGRPEG